MYGKLFVLATIFALGLYFITHHSNLKQKDGFTSHRCPNVLIQEGSKINLFNTNIAEVPGVNPIQFENLNEYVDFMRWQRSQGIRCPVLYLQQAYDVQNNPVYKARPDPDNMNAGAPDFNVNSEEANKLLTQREMIHPTTPTASPHTIPITSILELTRPLTKCLMLRMEKLV